MSPFKVSPVVSGPRRKPQDGFRQNVLPSSEGSVDVSRHFILGVRAWEDLDVELEALLAVLAERRPSDEPLLLGTRLASRRVGLSSRCGEKTRRDSHPSSRELRW